MDNDDEQARESRLLVTVVDPLAKAVLDATEPWDAYEAAHGIGGSFVDQVDWMPHGGSLYAAWTGLTDLFATGKTPLADAHRALSQAATEWLDRTGEPTDSFVVGWLERVQLATSGLMRRDGDSWREPS